MKIMVSACLAGENCKYNGGNNRNEKVLQLMQNHEVIITPPRETACWRASRWRTACGPPPGRPSRT